MRVVNGKKFYNAQINDAVRIDDNGWNRYDGRNKQWYTLRYNPDCNLVVLEANNSGDCYGDYETRYFDSPISFVAWCKIAGRDVYKLLGDIDETNEAAMKFVDSII